MDTANEFIQKGLVTAHSTEMMKYGLYTMAGGVFVFVLYVIYAILENYGVYKENEHIYSYFNIIFGLLLVMTFLTLSKNVKDNSPEMATTMFMAVVVTMIVLGLLCGFL